MIQVDIPLAAAMGAAAAGAARRQLRAGGREEHLRTWLETNLFLIFGFSWIPIYFLINHFGWETTHLWWSNPVSAYPWFIPVALLLIFAFGNAGYLLGSGWVHAGRDAANRTFYLGILGACVVWMVGFYPRTMKLGLPGQWQSAPWCHDDPAFMAAWAFTTAVWFGSFGFLLVRLARRGRAVHAHT